MPLDTNSIPSSVVDDKLLRDVGIGSEMRLALKRAREKRRWSYLDLARAMGRRNINKAVRRLQAVEDCGACDRDLLLRVASALDIPLRIVAELVTNDEIARLAALRSREAVPWPRTATLPAPQLSWVRRFPDAHITAATAARVCGCMEDWLRLGGGMISLEAQRGKLTSPNDGHVDVLDPEEHDRRRPQRKPRWNKPRRRFTAHVRYGGGYSAVGLVAMPVARRTNVESEATACGAPVLWVCREGVQRLAPGDDATHIDDSFSAARLAHYVEMLLQRAGERPHVERLELLPHGMDDVRGFVVDLVRLREARCASRSEGP